LLIPENWRRQFYGDGGAGKTTLATDLACDLAAGEPWSGSHNSRARAACWNEGPWRLFRAKLLRKRFAWTGPPLGDRVRVVESPWTRLSIDNASCAAGFADELERLKIDVVTVGDGQL
jgi:hypothetical protein